MSNYDPEAAGAHCEVCPLNGCRVVPPKGPPDADFVVVGEGPGMNEERRGEPFIGPSGVMLTDILEKVGVNRRRVFLTNALLCRADTPGVSGSKRYDLKTYLAWLRKENQARRKKARKEKTLPDLLHNPLECCKPRLWRELQWFENRAKALGQPNGALVVPVGNFAAWAVVGKLGIMKLRGSPISIQTEE